MRCDAIDAVPRVAALAAAWYCLRRRQVTVDTRIPAILINIQHEQLERMGVSKQDGQNALNRYTRETATKDKAAHQRVDEFTHT